MELKTGDIVLFHSDFKFYSPISYLSAAIRFFADIYYNHVGIIIKNWDVPMVNEAVGRGIISDIVTDRLRGKEIKILRPKFEFLEKELAIKANNKLGNTGYDFSGLLFYQLIFQLTKVWIGTKNKQRAEKRMYCYEYVAFLINQIKPDIYQDWWEIDPNKLINDSDNFEVTFEGKYR